MKNKANPEYYFALREILADQGISQKEARKIYGFDQPGAGYISRTGFVKLCGKPKVISMKTINILCRGMSIDPGQLWKMRMPMDQKERTDDR